MQEQDRQETGQQESSVRERRPARAGGKEARGFDTQRIAYIGIFAALIAVCSQISIPMPAGVPMTLQTLIVPLAGLILGAADGAIAAGVYLLMGLIGLPVFANFGSGAGVLFGITGGFLLSFPLMAWITGMFARGGNRFLTLCGLIAGAAANYATGTLMFALLTKSTLAHAFSVCVLVFIPTTILKILIAWVTGPVLRTTLKRAGLLRTGIVQTSP